jgi:hypothetical protein
VHDDDPLNKQPKRALDTDEIAIMGEVASVFRVGLLGQLTVTVWFGRPDKAAALVLSRISDDCIARMHGEQGSSVHLVNARVKLPDADARDVLAQIMKNSGNAVACAAVVVDGGGFWASALRSFITGLRVLAPGTVDLHAYASIQEVLAWLPAEHHKRTGKTLAVEQVERLLSLGKTWQDQEALSSRD